MTVDSDTGLVRVAVVAAKRRLDLAIPENLTLASILPALLSHAGEDVVNEAGDEGGWTLRRGDGRALDVGRSALAQDVRDGEVLHLVRAQVDGPEPEYDDVVEAIAADARQGGLLWDGRVSRAVGAALAGAMIVVALGVSLAAGPRWTPAALLCLAIAAGCLAGGAALARMPNDQTSVGLILSGFAQPAAFTGGLLLFGGDEPLARLGAPHLLTGCLALLLSSLVGQVAVPRQRWIFTAAAMASAAGGFASVVALTPLDGPQAAAISTSVLLIALPIWPALAARMGRLPLPAVPRSAADLVRDDPLPPATVTFAAVARADVVLTGLLVGGGLIAAIGLVLLSTADGMSAPILIAVASAAFLLRARLFPAVRHRLPLLLCGLSGVAALVVTTAGPILGGQPLWSVPVLAVLAAVAVVLGVRYHHGRPSVYLARAAEVVEVILLLSVTPLACGVLGLYTVVRGVAG